ncbi:MAG: efflux RND transporter periplasmic adaptor subunit [Isosphaeraceae bacterium]
MIRVALTVLVVGAVVAGLAAANLSRAPGAVALDWQIIKPPELEVQAESPSRGAIVQTIHAPGKVESEIEAEIASQLVGRVVEVHVKEGSEVKEGDTLVVLDDTDSRARLDSSLARISRLRSAIEQSEKDLEKALRDANQSGKLAGRGFSTPTELADARTAVAKAQAALAMSRQDLVESEAMRKTAEKELTRTIISAPIEGVVSGMNVDVGEVVIAGTTNLPGSVLMTVSGLKKMRVRAEIDETDVPLVRHGQTTRIYLQADPINPVPGTVDLVSHKGKVKNDVVSFETLVTVDENWSLSGREPKLRPGMSATVEVEVKRSDKALSVPAQAVVHRRRKDLPDTPAIRAWSARNARSPGDRAQELEGRYVKIVFVLDGEVARARPVETGLSDERRVEILDGLAANERIVVGPFRALDELKDGQAVKIVATPAAGVETSAAGPG